MCSAQSGRRGEPASNDQLVEADAATAGLLFEEADLTEGTPYIEIARHVRRQAELAIEEADAILGKLEVAAPWRAMLLEYLDDGAPNWAAVEPRGAAILTRCNGRTTVGAIVETIRRELMDEVGLVDDVFHGRRPDADQASWE